MRTTKEIGDEGEEMAAAYLHEKGFVILEEKWRFGRVEVDLIAQKGNVISFVEVKLRKNAWAGQPWEFVTTSKQRSIIKAADRYVQWKVNFDPEIRFDVVSIIHNQEYTRIEHLENAFYPTL
ncbi:YraN family protein [Sanyastnella coralliicola]|uniref:YraN family protein n=1 Tax=Sanyastnella coralliicola TaxID=3069118 RepID=UPI0027B9E106|nr:YraN family protein [Longitalea sp. SCSIO 12813]